MQLPKESKTPPKDNSTSGKKPDSSGASQPRKSSPKAPWLPKINWSLASWIRWLIYAAMLAAAVYGFLRYREQVLTFLRQMIEELKSIWRELFGRKRPAEAEIEAGDARPIPRPFSTFSDPFVSGAAAQSKPDQLVRYTFAALDAWAFERGLARRPEATPHEFTQQIGDGSPEMAADLQSLANLYAKIIYARRSVTPDCLPTLRRVWQQLRAPEKAVV
jgi:hypothetical protein